MASFKGILKVLVGIEHIAVPVLSAAIPALAGPLAVLDNLFGRIPVAITTIEANNPVTLPGPQKAQAVATDFEAGLELTNQILAIEGKTLSYDKVELQKGIDSQVAAFNSFAAVKASFKIVPLTTPAP